MPTRGYGNSQLSTPSLRKKTPEAATDEDEDDEEEEEEEAEAEEVGDEVAMGREYTVA